jgi:hypothetical protein
MNDSNKKSAREISLIDKVLLVAASRVIALRDYKNYSAHLSAGDRYSQPSSYVSFYHSGVIDRRVPKILGYVKRIDLREYKKGEPPPYIIMVGAGIEELNKRFFNLIEKMKANDDPRLEDSIKIIFLSSEEDERTVLLDREIPNDKLSKSGKTTRFVQSQRYVSLAQLKTAQSTSELESSTKQ